MSQVRRWELQGMAIGSTNSNQMQRITETWRKELKNVKAISAKIAESNAQDPEITALVTKQDKLMADYAAVLEPLMWLPLQSVCKPQDRAVEIAHRIATGDLS